MRRVTHLNVPSPRVHRRGPSRGAIALRWIVAVACLVCSLAAHAQSIERSGSFVAVGEPSVLGQMRLLVRTEIAEGDASLRYSAWVDTALPLALGVEHDPPIEHSLLLVIDDTIGSGVARQLGGHLAEGVAAATTGRTRVGVWVAAGDDSTRLAPTTDTAAIQAHLRAHVLGTSTSSPLVAATEQALAALAPGGALDDGTAHRELVLITDGHADDVPGGEQAVREFDRIRRLAAQAGVSISVIVVNVEGGDAVEEIQHVAGLSYLARDAGGRFFEVPSDGDAIVGAVRQVMLSADTVVAIQAACLPDVSPGDAPFTLISYRRDQAVTIDQVAVPRQRLGCPDVVERCSRGGACAVPPADPADPGDGGADEGAMLHTQPLRHGGSVGWLAALAGLLALARRRQLAIAVLVACVWSPPAHALDIVSTWHAEADSVVVHLRGTSPGDDVTVDLETAQNAAVEDASDAPRALVLVVDDTLGGSLGPQQGTLLGPLALTGLADGDLLGAAFIAGPGRNTWIPPTADHASVRTHIETSAVGRGLQSPVIRVLDEAIAWIALNRVRLPAVVDLVVITDGRAEDLSRSVLANWQIERLVTAAVSNSVTISTVVVLRNGASDDSVCGTLAERTGGAYTTVTPDPAAYTSGVQQTLSALDAVGRVAVDCSQTAPESMTVEHSGVRASRTVWAPDVTCASGPLRAARATLDLDVQPEYAADTVAEGSAAAASSRPDAVPADEGEQSLDTGLIYLGVAAILFAVAGILLGFLGRGGRDEDDDVPDPSLPGATHLNQHRHVDPIPYPPPPPHHHNRDGTTQLDAPIDNGVTLDERDDAELAAETAKLRACPSDRQGWHALFVRRGRTEVAMFSDDGLLKVLGGSDQLALAPGPAHPGEPVLAQLSLTPDRKDVVVGPITNGVTLSAFGRPLQSGERISAWMSVTVGRRGVFEVRSGRTGAGARPAGWELRRVSGPTSALGTIAVSNQTTVIGYDPTCRHNERAAAMPRKDDQGRHNGISANHATVWVADGIVVFCDEASTHGSTIDDRPAIPMRPTPLRHDSVISLARGAVSYRVVRIG